MKVLVTILSLILAIFCTTVFGALKGDDCEVCLKTLKKFKGEYDEKFNGKSPSRDDADIFFKRFCKGLKGKEERFCYYVGGLETSATGILNKITDPIMNHMPETVICEKLKKADGQICELKYDRSVDFTTVKFNKLKVKELKKILENWGEYNACKGCAEKTDFVSKIEELLPKYEPEAAKARHAKKEL